MSRRAVWASVMFLLMAEGLVGSKYALEEEMEGNGFKASLMDYQQVDPKPKLQSPIEPAPVEHLKPLPPLPPSASLVHHASPPPPSSLLHHSPPGDGSTTVPLPASPPAAPKSPPGR